MANRLKFTPEQINFVVMTYERNIMDKFRNVKLVQQELLGSFHMLECPNKSILKMWEKQAAHVLICHNHLNSRPNNVEYRCSQSSQLR